MKKRTPAVEGRFYPSSKSKILAQIGKIEKEARYTSEASDIAKIYGAVLPHAGHLYSGHQTVPFFKLLKELNIHPDTFIIVHPNHSGYGAGIAIDDSDVWINAIGEVPVDREFAHAMELSFDHRAHSGEHSAEVIVPFIQYYLPHHPFKIVAVCMGDQGHDSARQIAQSIEKAKRETGRNIMVLASCDFSHFLSPDMGKLKDQHVVEEILSRNAGAVEQAVEDHHVSVCGYGPIMTLMDYSMSLDQEYRIRILARGHSGEVVPSGEVVNYISMIMYQ